MPQTPTKQELAARALEIFGMAKRALPHADWVWRDDTLHQEWRAETRDATLLDAVCVHNALEAELYDADDGWDFSSNCYDSIHWKKGHIAPTEHMQHAYEFTVSMDLDGEALRLDIRSDVGKVTAYDHPDPDDPERWIRLEEWKAKQDAVRS